MDQPTNQAGQPSFDNTGQVIDQEPESDAPKFYEPTEADKELLDFVVGHTDDWRDYRDQNYMKDWERYERVFYGKWEETDKERSSERSRVISPATQQAVETRHAEIMESIFGQGEFFDINDDLADQNGPLDVEKLKKQLYEDFRQNKIRKSIDQITLLAEIYGTGIGEIVVESKKKPYPMQIPMDQQQVAYGTGEKEYVCVKLVPVNPKNFLFDPNASSVDECMGVAVERYVSIHKIAEGIASGKYKNVDTASFFEDDSLEPTAQPVQFDKDKIKLLTYYGLVPREYLIGDDEMVESMAEGMAEGFEDYADMVEAIIVIANGEYLLKAEPSPYMMKDRPLVTYQADTVPNRLLGRGTCEKADNMQRSIDGSARSHMDALALTVAPMVAIDATRWPRGAKFQVQPGKAVLTNGNPAEIITAFKFGQSDGAAMETSKEFERMLLMATATIDSNGQVSQVARDTNMDMATATLIKKYKRTLVNFQEDFLIPFVNKATWRYMQFDPERYPSVDMTFVPTGALGVIGREFELKRLTFMMQTLGADSPLMPVLMQMFIRNTGMQDREQVIAQMQQMMQPNPQQQQLQQQGVMLDMAEKQANVQKTQAEAQKATVEAQLAPKIAEAKIISALTNNLDETNEDKSFQRRIEIANLALTEKDIDSNERIARMQAITKLSSNASKSNSAGGMQ